MGYRKYIKVLSILLMLLGIILAFISTTADFRLIDKEQISLSVSYGVSDKKLTYKGLTVKIFPEKVEYGVKIYILTEAEYNSYKRRGSLPQDYISYESKEPYQKGSASWLVIDCKTVKPTNLVLKIHYYSIHMPLSLLSIPSYFMLILGLSLFFINFYLSTSIKRKSKET